MSRRDARTRPKVRPEKQKKPGKHKMIVTDTGATCTGCNQAVKSNRSACPKCGPYKGYHYRGRGKAPVIKGLVYLGAIG